MKQKNRDVQYSLIFLKKKCQAISKLLTPQMNFFTYVTGLFDS